MPTRRLGEGVETAEKVFLIAHMHARELELPPGDVIVDTVFRGGGGGLAMNMIGSFPSTRWRLWRCS